MKRKGKKYQTKLRSFIILKVTLQKDKTLTNEMAA